MTRERVYANLPDWDRDAVEPAPEGYVWCPACGGSGEWFTAKDGGHGIIDPQTEVSGRCGGCNGEGCVPVGGEAQALADAEPYDPREDGP